MSQPKGREAVIHYTFHIEKYFELKVDDKFIFFYLGAMPAVAYNVLFSLSLRFCAVTKGFPPSIFFFVIVRRTKTASYTMRKPTLASFCGMPITYNII